MDDKLIVALVGLIGVVVGVVVRDVVMALFLTRKKRDEEIDDRAELRLRSHRELVRHYADPLLQAVRSLRSRLDNKWKPGQLPSHYWPKKQFRRV
jgi:hypothetical protein